MGVPYKWGGTTADGFDCSGFTQHVLKSAGYSLPRTAGDQYQKSTKIELENVQCGDLVFFKNDAKISHVGMILSRKGNQIKMIHASSSKGISIVEINGSEYWKKRYFACGTYIK
jgi:cell wall-associated NlpC family hydrolase